MQYTAWSRIVGGALSSSVCRWAPCLALALPRVAPSIPNVPITSGVRAFAASASRSSRGSRTASPESPEPGGYLQETGLPGAGVNGAADGTSTAAGAAPVRGTRTKNSKSNTDSPPVTSSKSKAKPKGRSAAADPADPIPSPDTPMASRSRPPLPPQPQAPAAAVPVAAVDRPSASPIQPVLATTPQPTTKPRGRRSKATMTAVAVEAAAAEEAIAAPKPTIPQMAPTPTLAEPPDSPTPVLTEVRRTASPAGVLLIVDGNYLANRSYFGYGSRGLSTAGGVPTTVTYGVVRALQAAIRYVRPSALAVVFDPPGPTFRSVMSLLEPAVTTAACRPGAAAPLAAGMGGSAAAGGRRPGAAAADLVRRGRLNWQDLATRLLSLAPILADMMAAADAEAAAVQLSYLQPGGSFLPPTLPPPPSSFDDGVGVGVGADVHQYQLSPPVAAGGTQPAWPPSAAAAAAREVLYRDMVEVLAAALGPELAAALGLTAEAAAEGLALVPSYKDGRLSKGNEFYTDLGNLQRLLGLMCIPPICRPWLEADDLAGLLVQRAVQHGMAVRILSGDRDLMQLVSDTNNVSLLYPASSAASSPSSSVSAAAPPLAASERRRRGWGGGGAFSSRFPYTELREADVVSALGVPPALVPDYKALTGDASDNLPGASGIGPKTAAQLLASYGSLAGVYDALDELSLKRRAALQAALPACHYTLTLARVLGSPGAPAAPADVMPEQLLRTRLRLRGFEPEPVRSALLELEMNSLARAAGPGGELWALFGGTAAAEGGHWSQRWRPPGVHVGESAQ